MIFEFLKHFKCACHPNNFGFGLVEKDFLNSARRFSAACTVCVCHLHCERQQMQLQKFIFLLFSVNAEEAETFKTKLKIATTKKLAKRSKILARM